MNKIAVITDTASDMSPEIARKFDIKLIPFHIIMNDKEIVPTTVSIGIGLVWQKTERVRI